MQLGTRGYTKDSKRHEDHKVDFTRSRGERGVALATAERGAAGVLGGSEHGATLSKSGDETD